LEDGNRIFNNNCDHYDGTHVVFYPKNMTPYELQEGIIYAYENFYSNSKIFSHLRKLELFYGFETLYVKHLFKKIIKQNEDYLDYLAGVSS
jgi:anaerobic magnesium-protoporphyrin IX monomethyl ester cyclase